MKYCLDVSSIPYGTGVSRYTSNLARALTKVGGPDITFFGTALRQFFTLKKAVPTATVFPLPPSVTTKLFHEQNWSIERLVPGIDVYHTWDWYLPKTEKASLVVTIHDLALFKYPDIAHPQIKAHHEMVMARVKELQPHIIAVSEATKADIVDLFDINPESITVVYEALPEESIFDLTIQDVLDTREKYDVGKRPYLLMVGTHEPRKNYPNQIAAWRKYKQEFDLIIAGKPGWETIAPEEGLYCIGPVSGKDLAALYSNARGLMYCSLAEGFGLPILEALHYEIPVLTSNCSSMQEIAADYTVKVDPTSIDAIATGIEATFVNPKLPKAPVDTLYSWETAAKQTLDVYKQAAGVSA